MYAVGEIALVVIGILIALQVNNWNEDRKAVIISNSERIEATNAIYTDLQLEYDNLIAVVRSFQKQFEGSIELMEVLENPQIPILDSTRLFLIVDELIKTARINRRLNTFDGLVASGKMDLLKNEYLINSLSDYYADFDNTLYEYRNENLNRNLLILFVESFNSEDLLKIKELTSSTHTNERLKEWFNNKDFYTSVSAAAASSGYYNTWFTIISEQAQSIISYMEDNFDDILIKER